MVAFRSGALAIVAALTCLIGLSARASASPAASACRYEIVRRPFLNQLKPYPTAPFSQPEDVAFAGPTLLALFSDEAKDEWHLVAWEGQTKVPRVLITQKGTAYGPIVTAPDGHRVALIAGRKDGRTILVYDVATGALSSVAFEKYAAHLIPGDPIWDPTGRYLAVTLEGFVGASILPRQVRVYEVQSGRRIRDTAPELNVEAELWDREGLLLRETLLKDLTDYDDPAYAYRYWRLASVDAKPRALRSVPVRSPDGKIELVRSGKGVHIRSGDAGCLLKLETHPSDMRPTDPMWLSRDRLILYDKDGSSWMIDVRAHRAQPLAGPDAGRVRFDGHNLVVEVKPGSFAAVSID